VRLAALNLMGISGGGSERSRARIGDFRESREGCLNVTSGVHDTIRVADS